MAENGFLSQEEIVALLSGEPLPERNVKPDTAVPVPDQTARSPECENTVEYDVEDNAILIVLSDCRTYYFETAIVRRDGKKYVGSMYPHIGTFHDSCLLCFDNYNNGVNKREEYIDIRYFPHFRNLQTYCWRTGGLPVYLENAGEDVLWYRTCDGVMELKPGERKLVCRENVIKEEDTPYLDRSDLYPAVFLD